MQYGNGLHEDVFEKAKQRSLSAFLEEALGVPARKNGSQTRMDSCPFCGASSPQSGKLRITSDRHWRCYQCEKWGTIVDAAMQLYPDCRTPLEAARYVADGNTRCVASPERIARERASDQVRREWGRWAVQRIRQASTDTFDQSVLRYLTQARGIASGVVQEAWRRGILAGMPGSAEVATQWLRAVVGDEGLVNAGLWLKDRDQPWIAGRPLIQFVDNCELAEFRILYKPKPGASTKKTLSVGLPGAPFFWRGADPTTCLVVEGCLEMLAGVTMGYRGHVVGTAGTGCWDLKWFEALGADGVQTFDLAFNNDARPDGNPGQEVQATLAKELVKVGLRVRDASPIEPGDINDALLRKLAKR